MANITISCVMVPSFELETGMEGAFLRVGEVVSHRDVGGCPTTNATER